MTVIEHESPYIEVADPGYLKLICDIADLCIAQDVEIDNATLSNRSPLEVVQMVAGSAIAFHEAHEGSDPSARFFGEEVTIVEELAGIALFSEEHSIRQAGEELSSSLKQAA